MDEGKKKRDWYAVIIMTVLIIAMAVAVIGYAGMLDHNNQVYQQKQAFLNDLHTCPDCGWTGHAGQMRIVQADLLHLEDDYYCPNCGALLGVY